MANSYIDENSRGTLTAVSSVDGTSIVDVYANPDTHRLLTESTDGGVTGPGSSTDNAVVRWNGTTGGTMQNSLVTIDDSGNVNAVSYKAGGTSPVADGTYTVGIGNSTNGTITIKGGIITAVQEAS